MTADDPIRAARQELADPAITRATDALGGEQAGDRIGRYKLLQIIGEGGMGTVWMAEQSEPVRRRVALKIIKLGMDTKEVVARFEAERQALAVMEHPHIARVFDGGATANGRPFFVMELVRGAPITTHCDQARLGLKARLDLFVKVCGAIHHAHQKGVIHRDIKPSNVLVTLHDGVAVPKVIDFGIAKATHAELTQRTLFTRYAQMIGTPEYMAPEQAEMSGLDIDTRADVYSLGVLLYELVTGSTPFSARDALSHGYQHLLKTIREIDPARPSNKVSTRRTAAAPATGLRDLDLAELSRQLRGDLDCIVMKALEKDRYRRYDSASAFAEDITRHLDNQPVHAAPPTRRYLLGKAIRRHRAAVTLGASVLALLVAGVAGTSYGLLRAVDSLALAEQAQRDAERAQLEAETVAGFTSGILQGVSPRLARGRDTTLLRELMDEAAHDLEASDLRAAPEAELRLRTTIGGVYESLGATAAARSMFETALRQARDLHPEPDLGTARLLMSLGRVDVELRQPELAKQHYEAARQILQRIPDDEARLALAQIDNDEGLQRQRDGDLDGAERSIRRAIATKREFQRLGDVMLSASLGNLGSVLSARGDLDAAAEAFHEALDIARQEAAGPSVELVIPLGNAAFLEMQRHRPIEAERLYRESLETARACYDADHHVVASALEGLAAALRAQGRDQEALPLLEEAHAMLSRLFEPVHPRRLRAVRDLVTCRRETGRIEAALELSAEAMATLGDVSVNDATNRIGILQSHGLLLRDVGRRQEAAAILQQALATARSHPEYADQDLAQLLLSVASGLDPRTSADEVQRMCREAVDLARRAAPSAGSLLLANAIDNLGDALPGEEGTRLLREALAMKREVAPTDHPDLAVTAKKLAFRLLDAGLAREAAPLAEQARSIFRLRLGEDHPSTLKAGVALATALGALGESDRARVLLEATLETARKLPPERGAPLVTAACARLIEPALARGDLETATALADEALAAWAVAEPQPGVATAIAHVNAGVVAQQAGRIELARQHLARAAELFERNPEPADDTALLNLMQLAGLEAGVGDPEAALQALERLLRMAAQSARQRELQFQAASWALSLELERGDPPAVVRAALRATALCDLATPDEPRPRHGARMRSVRYCLDALPTTSEPAARRALLDSAETAAREALAICEHSFADDREFCWLIPDAASWLGFVLLARSRDLTATEPTAAEQALAEARTRILGSATEMWSDRWVDGRRPPTTVQAAARAVELLEHLHLLEPAAAHDHAAAEWRSRAGLPTGG